MAFIGKPKFRSKILKIIFISIFGISKMWSAHFCALSITGNMFMAVFFRFRQIDRPKSGNPRTRRILWLLFQEPYICKEVDDWMSKWNQKDHRRLLNCLVKLHAIVMNKKIRKYGRPVFSFIFRYAFLTKI